MIETKKNVSEFFTLPLTSGLFAKLAVQRFLNRNIYFVPSTDLRNNTSISLVLTGFPSLSMSTLCDAFVTMTNVKHDLQIKC